MTDLDRQLLDLAQRQVPLVPHPYAALAESLGISEQFVLDRLAALRARPQPVVREISAVLEATSLGYASALVACQVDADALDRAGAVIAAHPGVSHCYAREGGLNLWYTLTLGPDSRLGLAGTAERLARQAGARQCHVLPTLKRYKIGVHVDAAGRMASSGGTSQPPPYRPLSEAEVTAIVALQEDLPNEPEPFGALAARAGLDTTELLRIGADFLARGVIRRYAAVLHHRRAGLEANVLAVWRATEAQADQAGQIAVQTPSVSHCYLRPAAPGWPYTLYMMIHGRSREDSALVIDQIHALTGLTDHMTLWSGKEYKKARVRYFDQAVARWEAEHSA